MASTYEQLRESNISRNNQFLADLGCQPMWTPLLPLGDVECSCPASPSITTLGAASPQDGRRCAC